MFLVGFGQTNIAVGGTVDVHEHRAPNKKCVLMDAGIFFSVSPSSPRRVFDRTGMQIQNSSTQFLIQVLWLHKGFLCLIS
jgi:hypothetical protein